MPSGWSHPSDMNCTGNVRNSKDTTEEFWDFEVLARCLHSASQTSVDDFLQRCKQYLGASGKVFPAATGRAALHTFLAGVQSVSKQDRRTVLICSFNCPYVLDAVRAAGLTAETFDLDSVSGRFDWAAFPARFRDDHLALVVPHLFGVPTDFRPVLDSARRRGIFVIEDCAHTFGGKIGHQTAGTVGDASIFSFGHDKPMSLAGGGLLLINRREIEPLFQPMTPAVSAEQEMMELRERAAFLTTRRWTIRPRTLMSRVRWRLSGRHVGSPPPPSGIGPLRAALGIWQLDRYERILATRNRNAAFMSKIKNWRSWHIDRDVSPAWLKQKMVPDAPVNIEALSNRLRARGLFVGPLNWAYTLDSAVDLPEGVNAAYVAKYGLDVPIHQRIQQEDMQFMADALFAASN